VVQDNTVARCCLSVGSGLCLGSCLSVSLFVRTSMCPFLCVRLGARLGMDLCLAWSGYGSVSSSLSVFSLNTSLRQCGQYQNNESGHVDVGLLTCMCCLSVGLSVRLFVAVHTSRLEL
jgi:hypothetical protein